jgi:hypothetical protein
LSRRIPNFDHQNRLAASIILTDPARHGGEGSLMVWHSLAVLQRLGKGKRAPRPEADERGQTSFDWERAA